MGNIFERMQGFLRGQKADTEKGLTAAITEVEAALVKERAALAVCKTEHDAAALDLLAEGNEDALAAGRAKIAASMERVGEIERGLNTLRERLAKVQQQSAEDATRQAWARTRKLLDAHVVAVTVAQVKAEELAQAIEVMERNIGEILSAMPIPHSDALRISSVPTFGQDFYARLSIYLFGLTSGRLGASGFTVGVAMNSPRIANLAREGADHIYLTKGLLRVEAKVTEKENRS
jgi:hypothetical protein